MHRYSMIYTDTETENNNEKTQIGKDRLDGQ